MEQKSLESAYDECEVNELELEYESMFTTMDDSQASAPILELQRTGNVPDTITIYSSEEMFVEIDLATGEHKFSENANIDELAKTFWEAISYMCPTGTGKLHTRNQWAYDKAMEILE